MTTTTSQDSTLKMKYSWDGLEDKKAELQRLARETVEKHELLDKVCKHNGWDLTGMVLSYIRDPNTVSFCLEAVDVGRLHVAMRDLTAELVWVHNLDFYFVRKEKAFILDPNNIPLLQQCDKQIELSKKKQQRVK